LGNEEAAGVIRRLFCFLAQTFDDKRAVPRFCLGGYAERDWAQGHCLYQLIKEEAMTTVSQYKPDESGKAWAREISSSLS
jgi:hypothetical protein